MIHHHLPQRVMRLVCVLSLLAPLSIAQPLTLVVPNGMATAEGSSSNAFPWGRGGTGLRIQQVYDSSNFTNQGITYPIIITNVAWRPDSGIARTWVATSYQTATVYLSTCPNDHLSLSTASFAANEGPDLQAVFSGPVSFPAGSSTPPGPAPFLVNIPCSVPFLYDPNVGDLNVETDLPIQTFTGTQLQFDVHGQAPFATRAYVSTGYPNPPLTINTNHGVVIQLTYTPAAGLHPNFSATPLNGPAALTVQFTDATFTSASGGVTGWAWDFQNDGIDDAFVQNPTFTYTCPGVYSVKLTAADAVNGTASIVKANYITVANYRFDLATSGGGVGDLTITPVPTGCGGAAGAAAGYTLVSLTTTLPVGTGPIFGMMLDPLMYSVLLTPAAPGNILHFVVAPPLYPDGGQVVLPPGTFAVLTGASLDAMMVFLNAAGGLLHYSNVDRVTF